MKGLSSAAKELRLTKRCRTLMPAGVPRWVRIYDNGGLCDHTTWERDHEPQPCCRRGSADRFTIVFTGRYRHKTGNVQWYVTSNRAPYHPQGIYLHAEFSRGYWLDKEKTRWQYGVDRPVSSHLGKRIKFEDLPPDVQAAVASDYVYLWDICRRGGWLEHPTKALAQEVVRMMKEAACAPAR